MMNAQKNPFLVLANIHFQSWHWSFWSRAACKEQLEDWRSKSRKVVVFQTSFFQQVHLRSKRGLGGENLLTIKKSMLISSCSSLCIFSLKAPRLLKRAGSSGLQHSSCLHWEAIPTTPLQLKLETSIWTSNSIWILTSIWKRDAGTGLCSLRNAVAKAQITWNPAPPDQRIWALKASTSHSIKHQHLQEQKAFSCANLVLVRVSSGHKYSLEICYAVTDLKQICLDYRIFSTVSQAAVAVHAELKQRGFFFAPHQKISFGQTWTKPSHIDI